MMGIGDNAHGAGARGIIIIEDIERELKALDPVTDSDYSSRICRIMRENEALRGDVGRLVVALGAIMVKHNLDVKNVLHCARIYCFNPDKMPEITDYQAFVLHIRKMRALNPGLTIDDAVRKTFMTHPTLTSSVLDTVGSWPDSEPEIAALQRLAPR